MLTLSAQQLAILGEQSFVDRFRSLLRETFPEETHAIPNREMDTRILTEVHNAADYGLVSEQSAATFVMAAWLLGPGFDTKFPAVNDRLTSPRLSEAQKASWLEAFSISLLKALEP
jgi:hypothetical protein